MSGGPALLAAAPDVALCDASYERFDGTMPQYVQLYVHLHWQAHACTCSGAVANTA